MNSKINISSGPIWGLDFGTTTTLIAESELGGSRLYPLGRAYPYLPSIVTLRNGSLVVGENAEANSEEFILRSAKRSITKCEYEITINTADGEQVLLVDEVILNILKSVHSQVRRDLDGSPIRLGCPSMWNAQQRARLLRLANEAGFNIENNTLIDEPVAACLGWYEAQLRKKVLPRGLTVVFDMGGGTLDIAAVELKTESKQAALYVRSSQGEDQAGDALDESIRQLLFGKDALAEESLGIDAYPGTILRAARKLKESLGDSLVAKTNVILPTGQTVELEITSDEVREAFTPQFNRAIHLLENVLKKAKLSEWDGEIEWASDLRRLTLADLLPGISNFILVGGMTQMPLLKKMLVEVGISDAKIFGSETFEPNQAVALGLGLDKQYENLNLDRPSYSFNLEWTKNGEQKYTVIHEAYSQLWRSSYSDESLAKIWRNEKFEENDSDSGFAVLVVRDVNGKAIEFEVEGEIQTSKGLRFMFGTGNSPLVKFSPNGKILMRGGNGGEQRFKISSWPIIGPQGGTLRIKAQNDGRDHTSGLSFHELPYD